MFRSKTNQAALSQRGMDIRKDRFQFSQRQHVVEAVEGAQHGVENGVETESARVCE